MEFLAFTSHASSLSALLPLIFFLALRGLRPNSQLQLYVLALILVSVASDAIAFYMMTHGQRTTEVFNIQDFVQFGVISLMFYKMCFEEYKTTFYIGFFTYIVFAATNSLFIQSFHEFQNMTWVTGNVIFILFSVTWMLHVLVNPPVKRIAVYGQFWVNTACFIYFSMSVFLFVMTNYVFVNMSTDVSRIFWSLHNLNNILKNILFAVAMFYLSKEDGKNAFAAS
jgi:hypothetical protein